MKLTFALKEFFRDTKSNFQQTRHFLLNGAQLEVTLVFADSDEKVFTVPRGSDGKFVLDLGPNDIPDLADAPLPVPKKRISRIALDFWVDFTIRGTVFHLLRIRQDFSVAELPTNSSLNIDYRLSPFSWTHSATSAMRTANASVHPLLDLSKLASNLIVMNALVLDISELWEFLHAENANYRLYKDLTEPGKVAFKVFAHLGGNAFIWYSVIPAYLKKSESVSPHVFYSPADYAEKQNFTDENRYLLDNSKQFEAQFNGESNDAYNGHTLLFGYLLPPVDDDRIPNLTGAHTHNKEVFIEWVKANRRNVVNFERAESKAKVITTEHWNLGAGFEKAFYGLGDVQPQQFLLMPQVVGTSGAVKGRESERHLKNITDAIFDVLQTNTELLGAAKDELVAKDKMVLSCYSESGWDLWKSSNENIDNIKAIIGIEPNSTNPKGAEVIPALLKKYVKVFIIGRHAGFGDHYSPKLPASMIARIRFLPDDPRKILKYPPDPDSNDFVRFRVFRMTDKDLDPLMLDAETDILDDLASGRPPITGRAVISRIFTELINSDKLGAGGDVVGVFYTHNFALTGGQDMTFSDPVHFYGKPVTYRTFFQQAVEEIG